MILHLLLRFFFPARMPMELPIAETCRRLRALRDMDVDAMVPTGEVLRAALESLVRK